MLSCLFLAPCLSYCELLFSELLLWDVLLSSNMSFFSWDMPLVVNPSIFYDKMSFFLSIITFWITSLMVLTIAKGSVGKKLNVFLIFSLCVILLMLFSSLNSVMFFMMFEFSMIPIILLILGWGYQPERMGALFNFFYFTSIPSMPFLIALLFSSSSWMMFMSPASMFSSEVVFFFIFTLFLVKMPLYFTHFWLPKAHVEAPVSGSMILAGVLLKMGGYGIIRFLPMVKFSPSFLLISSLSSVGLVFTCIICLLMPDLKSIVAYSSVSHMNFMIVGALTSSSISVVGAMIMMMAHALCSSGLFYMCDVMYKRTSSRSLMFNKSSVILSPMMSFWWMTLCLFNMAFPLTPGNLSELLLGLPMVKNFSWVMLLILMLYFLLSAYYTMYIYYSVNHGSQKVESLIWPMTMKENLCLTAHVIPCFILVLTGTYLI